MAKLHNFININVISRWFLSICMVIGLHIPCSAQKKFDFDLNTVLAYHAALSLKIDEATRLSAQAKAENPANLAPYFIDNYIDFIVLFFNENPTEYKLRKPNKAKRLAMFEEADSRSPLTLFSQAIVHMQWAAIHIKFGDRWAAGWSFKDAFRIAKTNQDKFPSFTPNKMITGPMQMVAGTIPKNMKWLSSLMGISGNLKTGTQYLNQFLNATDPWSKLFHNEGVFYHSYLQFYLQNQPEEALSFIKSQNLDLVNNHLFTYMAANMNLNNKQSAITQRIISNRNKSSAYMTTQVWDFEMAYAKLYHLDDDADYYFRKYLTNFKGRFYVKDAWLKYGWFFLIQNNIKQYNYCMSQVIARGATDTDADKRALKEAKSGIVPNIILLKSRLLSDGGYTQEALTLLKSKTTNDFDNIADQLEFNYRLARIYDDLGKTAQAKDAYLYTMENGKNRSEYYAARSALQLAIIYENSGQKQLAKKYFQLCIDMEGHDYEDSLEQRAKAGIVRCNQ